MVITCKAGDTVKEIGRPWNVVPLHSPAYPTATDPGAVGLAEPQPLKKRPAIAIATSVETCIRQQTMLPAIQ